MLKLAGESDIGLEKIETIEYEPGLQNTGNLESGTNTITATSEASGTGNADYSASLTLAKPSDVILEVKRIAARLAVTIDSMTAGHLYCRVYVDSQDANHRLFDEDWTSTGAKLDAVDTHSGALSTIFDALSDGASHTFYFFFWVDANQAVISVVQLWEAVGTCSTSPARQVLTVTHTGLMSLGIYAAILGTGSVNEHRLILSGSGGEAPRVAVDKNTGSIFHSEALLLCESSISVYLRGTVATDIIRLHNTAIILRSEQ